MPRGRNHIIGGNDCTVFFVGHGRGGIRKELASIGLLASHGLGTDQRVSQGRSHVIGGNDCVLAMVVGE